MMTDVHNNMYNLNIDGKQVALDQIKTSRSALSPHYMKIETLGIWDDWPHNYPNSQTKHAFMLESP